MCRLHRKGSQRSPSPRDRRGPLIRKVPDTFKFLRHVMRAILSVRPKCSHRCVSLKEDPLKPVQILKHTTKNSADQPSMRTKWFKHIAIKPFRRISYLSHTNHFYVRVLFPVPLSPPLSVSGNLLPQTSSFWTLKATLSRGGGAATFRGWGAGDFSKCVAPQQKLMKGQPTPKTPPTQTGAQLAQTISEQFRQTVPPFL